MPDNQRPYVPDALPLTNLDYQQLLPLVGQANAALARYDGLLQSIPNPAVMLSPLTTQEAVLSSKIEGTQATVDEVLEQEAGLLKEGEKFQDIQEISNYRQALYAARAHLKDYPIRLSFVRELHRILMNSVRGQDKTPGEFRKDQNWIGKHGCTMEQATFIPPNPLQLPDHLQAWERYLDSDDVDFLLQVAVVHAQFELLHPFKDGNGRIGRILIPLFLYQKRALSQPMFYLSQYLESHREEYYQRLKSISAEADWNGWLSFFLHAIATQATQNSARVTAIQALYEEMKLAIQAAAFAVHDARTGCHLQQTHFSFFGFGPATTPGIWDSREDHAGSVAANARRGHFARTGTGQWSATRNAMLFQVDQSGRRPGGTVTW